MWSRAVFDALYLLDNNEYTFILQKLLGLKVHENNLKISAFTNSMYTNAYGRSALISQNSGSV